MRSYALIPAYNEAQTISQVVTDVKQYVNEVIVVDDGSLDATSSEARRGGAFVLRHIINRGQGAALQTGLDFIKEIESRPASLTKRGERTPQGSASWRRPKEGNSVSANFVVITFDADGQFEASEIPRMLQPIQNGEADVVLGSRFLRPNLDPLRSRFSEASALRIRQPAEKEGGLVSTKMPMIKKMFLKCAVFLTNLLTGLKLTDTHNGFRALSHKAINLITITQDRMAHGSEILFEIVKHNLSYQELPATVRYSAYSLSKGQKPGDYFKILFDLFLRKLVQ